jgi:Short C-terminal domain
MFRRRRPLLRAAAVGGGAYALGSHNANSRAREADQDAQIQDLQSQTAAPAPVAAPASGGISSDAVEKLQQLAKLHEQGVLTDEEFTAQKERLLA